LYALALNNFLQAWVAVTKPAREAARMKRVGCGAEKHIGRLSAQNRSPFAGMEQRNGAFFANAH
jgi:hypothetical protein